MPTPLEVAIDAARQAAIALTGHFANLESVSKSVKHDATGYDGIVTSADLEAEQTIVGLIQQAFPEHRILSEEEHNDSTGVSDIEHLWIIDPLDGTNNFAHGIDHYAVSIAYYRFGKPESGVVLRPESDDLYWAQREQGAWHSKQNGTRRKASVNQHQRLQESMVGVGFYYDRGEMMKATLGAIEALFGCHIHGIRRMGTAALDIVQVGLGGYGAFFEYQFSPWDFAAARLFLTEAGGTISTCDGSELPIASSSVLATNGLLHDEMLAVVGTGKEGTGRE